MTDNRATELREKLDALGIEHFDYDNGGRTQTMWEAPDGKRHFTYETQDNPAKTAKLVISWFPTPEQAIAATLGGQPARLTAWQVREAVLENFEETHETRYDHWEPSKFDWQAIADELNATLWRGTCEYVIEDNMNETEGMGDVWFRCTNCGTSYDYYADEWLLKMPYCPRCGCEVER